MRVEELLPGCKVDIRITQLMERDEPNALQGVFYTSIFDVKSDCIELQMPMVGRKFQLLPKNIRYEFVFSTDNGLYKAPGTVVDHVKQEHFYLLKIVLTGQLEKFQRREYYRITCTLPMIFMAVAEEVLKESTIEAIRERTTANNEMAVRGIGMILDISGGGARFTTGNSLHGIDYLLLEFDLPQGADGNKLKIEVLAKVINSEQTETGEKYMHRVKFYFKESHMKEQLIAYIFREERRIRKKEQEI